MAAEALFIVVQSCGMTRVISFVMFNIGLWFI